MAQPAERSGGHLDRTAANHYAPVHNHRHLACRTWPCRAAGTGKGPGTDAGGGGSTGGAKQ